MNEKDIVSLSPKIQFSPDKAMAKRPRPLRQERLVERAGMTSAGVRVRGNANNANCSPRAVNSNNAVSNCNANNAGSAQVLISVILAAGSAEK